MRKENDNRYLPDMQDVNFAVMLVLLNIRKYKILRKFYNTL